MVLQYESRKKNSAQIKKNTNKKKRSQTTKNKQTMQRRIRIKHHVVLRAELSLGHAFQNVLEFGDALLHEIPSLLEVDSLPLTHRHDAKQNHRNLLSNVK